VISRAEGVALSRVQYERFADVLDSLAPEEWAAPTDCPGWVVKAVASHVLGGRECVRRPREFVRQYRAGRRLALADPNDGLNAVQVREHASWPPERIAGSLRALIGPALAHRARTPWLLRQGVRPRLDVVGRVPLGWVLDVVYTRDTFLHRVDVCRAVGRPVFADHVEQRIVADIADEWAVRHGQPVTLRLAGPAGGTYSYVGGGPSVECDAVEFARLVSGRGEAEGLLATRVQF
jgi:uncharacterized protein (TIGR03083 family)